MLMIVPCSFFCVIINIGDAYMNYIKKELEEKKKELNSLAEEYFSLSKHDEAGKGKIASKMRKLENEVQLIYNELKGR